MASAMSDVRWLAQPLVSPRRRNNCSCATCRKKRERELEALIQRDVSEGEVASSRPKSASPEPGHLYTIKSGDTLLGVAGRAYGAPVGSDKRLKDAQKINAHPENQKFWVKPTRVFDKQHFSGGIIAFSNRFNCKSPQGVARKGEKRCLATIWIPGQTTRETPNRPSPGPGPANRPKHPSIPGERPQITPAYENLIQPHLHRAVLRAGVAANRCEFLLNLSEEDLARAWNNGRERVWFGRYERGTKRAPAMHACEIIRRIYNILRSGEITFVTNDSFDPRCITCVEEECGNWGSVKKYDSKNFLRPMLRRQAPKPWEITLGSRWFHKCKGDSTQRFEMYRTLTIVHEAAHLAGAIRMLKEIYDPKNAQALARRNAWGARVNAQNYALYILEKN
jgi:hypothetical protein